LWGWRLPFLNYENRRNYCGYWEERFCLASGEAFDGESGRRGLALMTSAHRRDCWVLIEIEEALGEEEE
jgi:hypothetical protein